MNQSEFFYILIANLSLLGSIALFTIHSWLPKLRPDWYYIFRIYEHNFLNYFEKKIFLPIKGYKDSYVFDQCEYDKSGIQPYIGPSGVYEWNFPKGQHKPIQFLPTENLSGELIHEAQNVSLDKIWKGQKGIDDFLKTWGVVILAIVVLGLMMYLISANQETRAILINMSMQR